MSPPSSHPPSSGSELRSANRLAHSLDAPRVSDSGPPVLAQCCAEPQSPPRTSAGSGDVPRRSRPTRWQISRLDLSFEKGFPSGTTSNESPSTIRPTPNRHRRASMQSRSARSSVEPSERRVSRAERLGRAPSAVPPAGHSESLRHRSCGWNPRAPEGSCRKCCSPHGA